ncbi:MAG: ATP-dependent DNA helicase RecG [Deltaproteobacteria bacterium]|nr:ATP-dependent DNA helicase RecG [Deltaproteobacteria bacterium]
MSSQPSIHTFLAWLKTPAQYAKGVGPKLSALLVKLSIHSFEDLLSHLPHRYLDRRELVDLAKVEPGKNRNILGKVYAAGEVRLGRSGRKAFEVVLSDGRAFVVAKWFRYHKNFWKQRFQKDKSFLLSGEVTLYRGELQMLHPEVYQLEDILDEEKILEEKLGWLPVYPSTEGIRQSTWRKVMKELLQSLAQELVETLPLKLSEVLKLPSLQESLLTLHQPQASLSNEFLLSESNPFRQRLAMEEAFYLQLGLQLKKQGRRQEDFAEALSIKTNLREKLLATLPFELTADQEKASLAINQKLGQNQAMNLLLQGDVGSGKTLVALLAALQALENQKQVALMAPTEILAEQHYQNFKKLLKPLSLSPEILTSSTPTKKRQEILAKLQEGKSLLLVGTHALTQEDVFFKNLSLVIVDEQHRFGVRQRLSLKQKGLSPHVLVMTATPIPRTLSLSLYGDLDFLTLRHLPKGRQPIQTRRMWERDRPKMLSFVKSKLEQGERAYFVFPLVEESEKLDLKAATQAFEELSKTFQGFGVGLLHGRMKSEEKESVMADFQSGKIQVLVSTTVIEVGIDVPEATVMVLEHAERFGLSQIHQLRGRVGRGHQKSYCILAAGEAKTETARERLKIMENCQDGFKIAEEDLKLRGPGDFLGTRQSGFPDFRFLNLLYHGEVLSQAREWVLKLLQEDPNLKQPGHQMLKELLRHRWQGKLALAEVG